MLYNDMMHVKHAIQTQYEQHVVWLISSLLHEVRLSHVKHATREDYDQNIYFGERKMLL